MPDLIPNPDLLHSLGRLVRGLSALFWGLPVALLVCVHAIKNESLHSYGIAPPLIVMGWLVFGLWELGCFQKQERIWVATLERAKLLGLVNIGLAPFLCWWNQIPDESFFNQMLLLLIVTGVLFLCSLNLVLWRLTAMLPDETMRSETKSFTTLNRGLLLTGLAIVLAYLGLRQIHGLPLVAIIGLMTVERLSLWLTLCLLLLPLAITMALIWKIKEVVLNAVFGSAGTVDRKPV
jgi:hypothetical protein